MLHEGFDILLSFVEGVAIGGHPHNGVLLVREGLQWLVNEVLQRAPDVRSGNVSIELISSTQIEESQALGIKRDLQTGETDGVRVLLLTTSFFP